MKKLFFLLLFPCCVIASQGPVPAPSPFSIIGTNIVPWLGYLLIGDGSGLSNVVVTGNATTNLASNVANVIIDTGVDNVGGVTNVGNVTITGNVTGNLSGNTGNVLIDTISTENVADAGNVTITGNVTSNVSNLSNVLTDTVGTDNVAVGHAAMANGNAGANNTATGAYALQNNTANSNTAYGYYALKANTSGTPNDAFGYQALYSNTTASNNTVVGYQGLNNTSILSNNTVIVLDAAPLSTITDGAVYTVDPVYEVLTVRKANSTSITVDKYPTYTSNTSTTTKVSIQKVVSGVVSSSVPSANNLIIKELLPIMTDDKNKTDNITLFRNKMDSFEIDNVIEATEQVYPNEQDQHVQ